MQPAPQAVKMGPVGQAASTCSSTAQRSTHSGARIMRHARRAAQSQLERRESQSRRPRLPKRGRSLVKFSVVKHENVAILYRGAT
jgi:hypothetical protein